MQNFKDIHIGSLIQTGVAENDIDIFRICNFLKCTEDEVEAMYESESLDSKLLLKWSKLLEYDIFRIYSHHLVLYAPPANQSGQKTKETVTTLPKFRKNIYTMELIYFILELVETGKKTRQQIMDEYRIPKTTLYKWIGKYSKKE
ncbi:transposase [Chryseobacterium sp. JM1]|uniref:transposase n=1 Tax=Chryseobacterium sp. JM1 TaxID=1233950 RepID=UPI0004E64069|nr:transposase [Chryseobacterium sp. JM1]KFF22553.1 transposase [Chryseobacterium sp. JM1]